MFKRLNLHVLDVVVPQVRNPFEQKSNSELTLFDFKFSKCIYQKNEFLFKTKCQHDQSLVKPAYCQIANKNFIFNVVQAVRKLLD
jgi:hypothetical protein